MLLRGARRRCRSRLELPHKNYKNLALATVRAIDGKRVFLLPPPPPCVCWGHPDWKFPMNFADWVWRHHFLKENGHNRAEALHETDIRMLEHCVSWHRMKIGRVWDTKQSPSPVREWHRAISAFSPRRRAIFHIFLILEKPLC